VTHDASVLRALLLLLLLLFLLFLGACATRDVLRSEPLVKRGVCGGHPIAVFGYPYENASCDATVIHLGDGCYLATVPGERPRVARQILHDGASDKPWAPHLFECSASAPDGHVACVEDQPLGRRDEVFGEDIARTRYTIALPYVSRTSTVTTGRCRARLAAWELANLPAPDPRELMITHWFSSTRPEDRGQSEDLPRVRLRTQEDPISIGRILGSQELVRATVCPAAGGLAVSIDEDYPARLEHELASMVRRALTEAHRTVAECTIFRFGVAFGDRPPG
jgi:hypothetical protein